MTHAKRLSALILTVIMMISIIPAAAMAAGVNGWQKESGKWYYYKNGEKLTGWIKDGGKWYFLNYDGEMAADTFVPESMTSFNKFYYVDKSGAMVTKAGWRKFPSFSSPATYIWVYVNKGGVLAADWKKIDGKWYYFTPIMISGELAPDGGKFGGKLYFFNKDGSMKSNCWVQDSKGDWYYLGKDGSSQTGWKKSGGKWYYLDPDKDGRCVTSTTIKDKDKWYTFDETGVCTNPEGSTENPQKGKPIELPFVPADKL